MPDSRRSARGDHPRGHYYRGAKGMYPSSCPTPSDWRAFCSYVHPGSEWGPDILRSCIDYAYLDIKRTLWGISHTSLGKGGIFYRSTTDWLYHRLILLAVGVGDLADHDPFDEWHRETCRMLVARYADRGFDAFNVGHAQKLVNMVLKYNYARRCKSIIRVEPLYPYCHAPIDGDVLCELEKCAFSPLPVAWSRVNNYDEYLDLQRRVRDAFMYSPLDTEFLLFAHRERIGAPSLTKWVNLPWSLLKHVDRDCV